MSFIRAATFGRSVATNSCRCYSTQPGAKNSPKFGLYLGGAGLVGLGTYVYMGFNKETPKKDLKSPLDPSKFIDLKLKRIEPYNHNTSKFVLGLGNGEAALLPVASCVYIETPDLKDALGSPMRRPYTPISPSDLEGELVFIIKKYETGNVSKHIHTLKPGDVLKVKGPLPKWSWKMNELDQVGLIGGGSGIAPLYQVLQHALADKSNKTKFKLLYANVTERDILLRDEFDAMKKQYPDTFDVVYVLDKGDANWKGPTGFISTDLVKQHIPPPSLGEKVKVFICGPPGQVASVAGKKSGMEQGEVNGILKELGYSKDQVYKF